MMASDAVVRARIDEDIKKEAGGATRKTTKHQSLEAMIPCLHADS